MSPSTILFVLACASDPPPPSVGERWAAADAEGRQALLAEIDRQPSPEAALLLLDEVERAAPGTLRWQDCDRLAEASVHEACLRGANRPHLTDDKPPLPQARHAHPFPSLWPPPQPSDLHQVAPADICGSLAEPTACRTRAAVAALEAGELQSAAAACVGIPAGKWRDECFFRAAEAAASGPLLAARRAAAPACFAAGSVVHECLSHAVDGWVDHPPDPRDAAGVAAWEARLAAISTAIIDSTRAAEAHTIAAAVEVSAVESVVRWAPGAPVDAWWGPPEHVLASLAARALTEGGELSDTAAQVLALARGEASLQPPTEPDQPPLREIAVLWEELLPAEAAWLAAHPEARIVPYRGYSSAVRVTVPDPTVDATIAVLEAAARSTSHREELLRQGQAHPEPVVRWTAARLGALVGTPMAGPDPDPLVASRQSAP